MVVNADSDKLFEYLLSDKHIGFNAKEMLNMLATTPPLGRKKKALYDADEGCWTTFPATTGPGCEQDVAEYFEQIAKFVDRFLPKDLRARRKHWLSAFANGSLTDGGSERRPDLVIVDKDVCERAKDKDGRKACGWRPILGTLEMKVDATYYSDALSQTQDYARKVFGAQPNRRYVIGVTFCGYSMQLFVFDRSGALTTSSFNVHADAEKFLRVAIGLLLIDPNTRGFDTTVKFTGLSEGTIEVGGDVYKFVDVLHVEDVIRGRGTVCYKVLKGDEPHLVKDSWVDTSRDFQEGEILNNIREDYDKIKTAKDTGDLEEAGDKVHEGVENQYEGATDHANGEETPGDYLGDFDLLEHIPDVVYDGAVMIDGMADSTANLRKMHLELDSDTNAILNQWKNDDFKKVEIREHRRMMMKPVGRRLEDFSCLGEFVMAFLHFVKALTMMFKLGYLHRDISLRNLLLRMQKVPLNAEEFLGLLINFEFTIRPDREMSSAVGNATGTLPFMAVEVLRADDTFIHQYYHDLESIFYVMIFVATVKGGPRYEPRVWARGMAYENTEVAKWNGERALPLTDMSKQKHYVMLNESVFEGSIEKYYGDYFKPIAPCLRRIRQLLFPTELKEGDIEDQFRNIAYHKAHKPDDIDTLEEKIERLSLRCRSMDQVCEKFVRILQETYDGLEDVHKIPKPEDGAGRKRCTIRTRRKRDLAAPVAAKDTDEKKKAKASMSPPPPPADTAVAGSSRSSGVKRKEVDDGSQRPSSSKRQRSTTIAGSGESLHRSSRVSEKTSEGLKR